MIPEKILILLFTVLGNATFANADVVEVADIGRVDLAPYVCTDITRSTMISRACYDDARRVAVIEVRARYRQLCDMPKMTFNALLAAPSIGQFYLKHIRGEYRFACAAGGDANTGSPSPGSGKF